MKKFLLRILLLACFAIGASVVRSQSIIYNSSFDLSSGAALDDNLSIGTQVGQPREMVFNPDGSKMFVIGDGEINQYSLSTPYRVDVGVTHDGNYSMLSEDSNPLAVTFSDDGMEMFIIGSGTNSVIQYNLSSAFDITSTVTVDGATYDVSGQQSNLRGMYFSPTGDKMYIYGANFPYDIDQYSLSVVFDISSTVTYDGALSLATSNNTAQSIAFSADGLKLLVLTTWTERIEQYTLSASFDLTGTVTQDNISYDLTSDDNQPTGIAFNSTGDRMFLLGDQSNGIYQYTLNPGEFLESSENDGTISNTVEILISGETFTSAGSTLTQTTDYSISGIPSGLTPVVSVAADGLSATLSLTGAATAHQDENDVSSLIFTFNNSAFAGGDASAVSNASSASSNISIDFKENNPIIAYGDGFDLQGSLGNSGTFSLENEQTGPLGMTFSEDGMKVYVAGYQSAEVNQYSLSSAFDVSEGVTHDGLYDVSGESSMPTDINFNGDGTKMFILDQSSRGIYQYSLSSPWDLTGTVTYDGSPYSVISEENAPYGMTFNPDGTKMYIVGFNGDEVNQYSLSSPFDITSGVTFDGNPFSISAQVSSGFDIQFNSLGTKMFILEGSSPRDINIYALNASFDITSGATYDGSIQIIGLDTTPRDIAFSSLGDRFFVLGDYNNEINQYDLSVNRTFVEFVAGDGTTDGSVVGSYSIYLADDQFTNAGGTLTHGVDYTISNLPAGLSPVFAVSADGESAELSFSGNASNHQNANDVNDLIFTFENSAFLGGSASKVLNGTSASSYFAIDFTNDGPSISYASIFDLSSEATYTTSVNVDSEETYPGDVVFNDDGLSTYIVGYLSGKVHQYSLASAYDLRLGMVHEGTFTTGLSNLVSLAFNNDGSKLYVLGTSRYITQYSLSVSYDITSTLTSEGTYYVGSQQSSPQSFSFSPDGLTMYVGGTEIDQYILSSAFDITSTVTPVSESTSIGSLTDFYFSEDGKKVVVLNSANTIETYSLATAYDVASGMTKSSAGFSTAAKETSAKGITFSSSGDRLFVTGWDADEISQFELNSPRLVESNSNNGSITDMASGFKLTDETFSNPGGTLSYNTDFTISNLPAGLNPIMTVASDGKSATLSFSGSATNNQDANDVNDLIFTFSNSAFSGGNASAVANAISASTGISLDFRDGSPSITYETGSIAYFTESFEDDGTIDGSFTISITDDSFTNPGGTLIHGTDYTITGVPSGLTPVLSVASDGWSAEFSLSGQAASSDIADNVADLVFTFNNSAFGNGNASNVANAVSASSGYGITFKEIKGVIYREDGFDLTSMSFVGSPFDISSQASVPQGMEFSADGSKLFVVANSNGTINQYSLTAPFDISSGATLDGTPYDVSANETAPYDIAFNEDGSKMYIIGTLSDKVHQYSLTTPFDINGTVSYDGGFAVTNGVGLTFSSDGSKMYTAASGSSTLTQYILDSPFDITGTVTSSGALATVANARSPKFAPNGKELFVLSSTLDRVAHFTLSEAFDITTANNTGSILSVTTEEALPTGFAFSADGRRLLLTGSNGDDINQYELPSSQFNEAAENSGAVDGSLTLKISGEPFANSGSTLALGSEFTASGIPSGLTPVISISADALSATVTFSGNADNHQDMDDLDSDVNITFLNGAFLSGDATEVNNTSLDLSINFNFDDNGVIAYTSTTFYETYLNEGEVEGEMTIEISNETFTNAGSNLIAGTDYSVTGVPSGLSPQLDVATNGLSATFTLTGTADSHQDVNDVADLVFTFENSAFTSTEAEYVFNAISTSTGSTIDFEDNNPAITYGNRFDLSTETPSFVSSLDISSQDDSPGGMAFSNDGMKIFIVGYANITVFEYNLATPFDVSSGVTYSGNSFDVSGEVNGPSDLVFDAEGTTMFILDGASDDVEQYSLSSGFDLTSTITHQGTFSVSTEDIQPSAITFSPNGKKMYMVGSFNDKIFQYTLSSPFDVTTGASYDGAEATISSRNYTDIQISWDGKRMFVSNGAFPGASYLTQFDLLKPFDISEGITSTGSFYFYDIDTNPTDMAVSPDSKTLVVLGSQFDLIYQFELPIDGFHETDLNNGEVTGSLYIEIDDERFTNAGGNLTYGSDYSIDNLPVGLSPSFAVASDGLSATVTLSGSATNHQDAHDVDDIQFTFNNSAFANGNAATVANASSGASSRAINFRDNNPALNYGNVLDMSYVTSVGSPLDVSNWGDYPSGIAFSNDGLQMFLSVYGLGSVYQYSLTQAYDITSGVSYIGAYDHSAEDMYAEDLAFSADGMRLFVMGSDTYTIYQYNLTTTFDVTSGVTYSGNSFYYEDFDTSIYGFTFNTDGSKMYLAAANSDGNVFQFTLSAPFTLSSVTSDGDPLNLSGVSPTGMTFSMDGRYLLMTEDNTNQTVRFKLFVPFDVTQGAIQDGTFDLDVLSIWGSGLAASPDGSAVFIANGNDYSIRQFDIDLGGFTETGSNDGTIEGSAIIYLIDDTFSNAGGSLAHGTDYTIANLPEGLIPSLTVDTEGYHATLTLSGVATSHGDANDITSLQFTFSDAAFTDYAANEVDNATGHSSVFSIDYLPYTDNDIASFSFSEIEGSATITMGDHTVTAIAVAGTDISSITPAISVSQGATVDPESDVVQDFTSPVTYTVTAEDGTSQTWEVSVTEQLAAPTDILLNNATIDENGAVDEVVGLLSAVDASFADSHTFSLVSGTGDMDNSAFSVSGNELRAAVVFDFESVSSYSVRVQADDGNGGLFEKSFTISINDVNETPTAIGLSGATVNESNPTGTLVGTFSSTDQDLGQTHTYTLVSGTGDVDNASFSVSGNELLSTEVFDFESKSSYSIRVRTDDGNGGTYEESFTITINDLPASVTDITLSNNSVDENEFSGTTVGSLTTFGEDLSGTFTYSLVAGTGDTDNAAFAISGSQLVTGESFNFENKSSYSVHIKTDDGTGNTFEKVFGIDINDVNDVPTAIELSSSSIAELNTIGDVVGILSSTDEDGADSHTYSLVTGSGDEDNLAFSINGNELRSAVVFDFETKSAYSVRVQTDDGSGGTYEQTFNISITNVNESVQVISSVSDQSVDEGFASFEIDLSAVFSDLDNDPLTYSAESSNTSVATVSISGTILTVTEVGLGNTDITVTADDGISGTTSDVFLFTVNNVNEAPTVANAISDQVFDEGFTSSEINLSAVFADGDGDDLALSAVSGDESIVTVSIEGTTLTISEAGGFGVATVSVTANDGNGESVTNDFTVTVNNVNEAPTVANTIENQTLNEGFNTSDVDLTDIFADGDGDALTITASSGDESIITVNVTGTLLTLSETGGFGAAVVTVTADDGNGESVNTQFTVTVNEVNVGPILAEPISDQTYDEGFGTTEIDLTDVFSDADGDNLTMTAASDNESIVTVSIAGTILTITERSEFGTTSITVTATDANGESVADKFTVTVNEVLPLHASTPKTKVKVYPQPAERYLSVEVPATKDGAELRISIVDLNGAIHLEKVNSKTDKVIVDIQHLANGHYLILLESEGLSTSTRFIKK